MKRKIKNPQKQKSVKKKRGKKNKITPMIFIKNDLSSLMKLANNEY